MSASTQRLSRLEIVVIVSQGSSLSNGVGRGVKACSLGIQSEKANTLLLSLLRASFSGLAAAV
jgi:hypothetical protein